MKQVAPRPHCWEKLLFYLICGFRTLHVLGFAKEKENHFALVRSVVHFSTKRRSPEQSNNFSLNSTILAPFVSSSTSSGHFWVHSLSFVHWLVLLISWLLADIVGLIFSTRLSQADYHHLLQQNFQGMCEWTSLCCFFRRLSISNIFHHISAPIIITMIFLSMPFFILNTSLNSNGLHCKRYPFHVGPTLMHRQKPVGEK